MMKRVLYLILFSFLLHLHVAAQSYAVGNIPLSLRANADAVKRMEKRLLRIDNLHSTTIECTYAITVLNPRGDGFGSFNQLYDKFERIRSVEGSLYDAEGRLVRRLRKKDVEDGGAVGEGNFIDDTRAKFHRFIVTQYPYTVEYKYVIQSRQTLHLTPWFPQSGNHLSVEQSEFIVDRPKDISLRFRSFPSTTAQWTDSNANRLVTRFLASNLKAMQPIEDGPPFRERTTAVYVATDDFGLGNFQGRMNSWNALSASWFALNAGRDKLPPNVIADVHALADSIHDRRETVSALYDYMQAHFRYVSLQLGISGWQAETAMNTFARGYGDCKALTNVMQALLKEAGIRSSPVLVIAGEGAASELIADFPSMPFNHVVLSVPLVEDTMWLECTGENFPAGYLGDFAGNREGLLIDSVAGKIVAIPPRATNGISRNVKVDIDAEANMKLEMQSTFYGNAAGQMFELFGRSNASPSLALLQRIYNLPDSRIGSADISSSTKPDNFISLRLSLISNGYAKQSGNRMFIVPCIFGRIDEAVVTDTSRTEDFLFFEDRSDTSRYLITFPAGFHAEVLPQDISIQSAFGSYSSKISVQGNVMEYRRIFNVRAGRYAASLAQAFDEFREKIAAADKTAAVFIKVN